MERIGKERKPIASRVVVIAGLMALAGIVPARRSVKFVGASFALAVSLSAALLLAPFAGATPEACPEDDSACQTEASTVPETGDDPLDPIEETTDPVTDPIEETTDPITDPIEETTDPITDPIEETTDPITDPIEETTDPITDPVEETLDPVLDDGGWDLPDTEEVLNPELPTLEGPTAPINDGVKDIEKTIEKIGSTETPTRPIDSGSTFERIEPVAPKDSPKQDGPSDKTATGDSQPATIAGFSEARSSSGPPADSRAFEVAFAADSDAQPGLFDRIGEISVDVAKKLAFPLLLLLLVAGFLLVHNRIDRKDPKLAHAPVSADNESLTFD